MPTDDLIPYIFGNTKLPLAVQFARWTAVSPRFRDFAVTYRDKLRKKVRGVPDAEGFGDLRAELATAYFLLGERRFAVEYEKYGVGKQRGPDFSVTFKTHLRFDVEVTRLRPTGVESAPEPHKLVNMLCGKLGQLPPGIPNILVVAAEDTTYTSADLAGAVRLLQDRVEHRDEEFFIRRGFRDRSDFLKQYSRLSGVRLLAAGAAPTLWPYPQARHPLPPELATIFRK
jgi:hypothetical protein